MIAVKSINGKNPFDFISEFGNNCLNFRSPHANFALKSEFIISFYTLTNYPFSYEELSKLNVVYESGDNFTINYLLITGLDLDAVEIKRNFLLKDNNIKKESFIDINKIPKNIEKNIIESNKNIININKKLKDFSMYIDWDYEFSNIFRCRADNENEINVYCFNNFRGEETSEDFLKALAMCAELFDNNTYPIALIGNLNEGDSIVLYHIVLEILSPLITSKVYTAFRKTEGIMKNKDLMSMTFPDAEKCEDHELKSYFNKVNKINYGNGITDELSEIFLYDGKDIRKALEILKLNLKNKRKPTDIVVIADGYSFSATSILLKYLQYYGGGITVGIYQHPNKRNVPFDSSTSPSPVFTHGHLMKFSDEYRIMNELYNFKLQLATFQTFYNINKIDVPLEYEITPVDEIEEIYELFYDTDRYYSLYIDKALKTLKKYETHCNPYNKKLVKVTNECDYTFKNDYTHGGYECGDDGYWSTKCVASYCDLGYIFDYAQGKCIIDYCSDLNKEGENKEDENEEEENEEEEIEEKEEENNEEENNEEEKNEEKNNEGNNKKEMTLIIVICSCIFALNPYFIVWLSYS